MGHPRACRNLSVEHVYKIRKKLNARVLLIQTGETANHAVWSEKALLPAIFNLRRSLLVFSLVALVAAREKQTTCKYFSLVENISPSLFLYTDLSAAGLPAELKHITQRRKRKQP